METGDQGDLESAFHLMDRNGDGFIDLEDISAS